MSCWFSILAKSIRESLSKRFDKTHFYRLWLRQDLLLVYWSFHLKYFLRKICRSEHERIVEYKKSILQYCIMKTGKSNKFPCFVGILEVRSELKSEKMSVWFWKSHKYTKITVGYVGICFVGQFLLEQYVWSVWFSFVAFYIKAQEELETISMEYAKTEESRCGLFSIFFEAKLRNNKIILSCKYSWGDFSEEAMSFSNNEVALPSSTPVSMALL